MKLLHCLNSPSIGGIERLVIELAIAQKKQGIDVSIILDTFKGQYYDYLVEQNIPLIKSNIKGGFDFNLKTYTYLKNIFNKYDIVHIHSFSPIRSMAANSANTKTVYTIHGLSKGIRKENKIKYTFRETLKKYFLNKVALFVANSKHTLKKAKEHYQLTNTKSIVILNGIKLPPPSKAQKNNINTEFIIGLVSRFTVRKRIDRLINGFNFFLEDGGNGKLILVGDGDNLKTVKAQVKDLKLEQLIEFTGYKNNVQDYYRNFDVCVQPSDNEGFGLTAVEAYLQGKPVIAFNDSGGLKEVITPLEPDNIVKTEKELAERLLFYSKNKNLLLAKSEKRIHYARTNFSIERMERDYYNAYKSVISQ